MKITPVISASLLALSLLTAGAPAFAEYPDHPVTIVVPFTAGGSSDIVARTLQPKLTAALGQTIIV